ncbi:phage tail protein [Beijerinckia mobilis]|uniref:phage tail protein n=1 Tax=Beijerinckia mobilis TaxID=231434 RepID=UPI000554323A|nr:phage tail protein [Beijerinckia mobilis]
MSYFRTKKSAAVTPNYTGMDIQTSSSALPIPIIYGTTRAAPNILWHDGFASHAQHSTAAGGKGGGQTVSSYTYSTWIMLGVGEGPIKAIGTIYNGQSVLPYGAYNLALMNGATPQDVWGQAQGAFSYAALHYNGTAYMASSYYDLGSNASIGSIAFEVYGLSAVATPLNAYDSDPAAMLYDFLTNTQYGVGFPAESIDAAALFGATGDASYQTYCMAIGIGLSPALTTQETASTLITRWLQLTNATAVWSGGLLRIRPYGDVSLSGNGYDYMPDTAPVYDLTDADFLYEDGRDPVQVARIDPYSLANIQPLECFDRSNRYAATPVYAFDQDAIERFGMRMGANISAHEICDLSMGVLAAQLILQRALYIRNTYTFKLSFEYCLLDPMDIVTLTDPVLGLDRTPVRIIAIEEDSNGSLTVTAEEFPGGIATATRYPAQGASGAVLNRAAEAGSVNAPVIFEPPSALSDGSLEVWVALSGARNQATGAEWGGAFVHVSLDGASYTQIGEISSPARQGLMTSALTSAMIDGLDVTLSQGTLASVSQDEARNVVTLCYLDGELLAYTNATLTASQSYALSGLVRGLFGTMPMDHAVGSAFARLDDAVFKYSAPPGYIGQTINLKFQSFNIFGAGVQDLSDCAVYSYHLSGNGIRGPVTAALLLGTSLDYGVIAAGIGEADDFGTLSEASVTIIALGSLP